MILERYDETDAMELAYVIWARCKVSLLTRGLEKVGIVKRKIKLGSPVRLEDYH